VSTSHVSTSHVSTSHVTLYCSHDHEHNVYP
jgi:hypothetical protein